jgi:hypothetical protein
MLHPEGGVVPLPVSKLSDNSTVCCACPSVASRNIATVNRATFLSILVMFLIDLKFWLVIN